VSCKHLLIAKLEETQKAGLKSIFKLHATIFGGPSAREKNIKEEKELIEILVLESKYISGF